MESVEKNYVPSIVLFVLFIFFGIIYALRILFHLEGLTLQLMYEYEVHLIIVNAFFIIAIATLIVELTTTLRVVKKITLRTIFSIMAIIIIFFLYKEDFDLSKFIYELIT